MSGFKGLQKENTPRDKSYLRWIAGLNCLRHRGTRAGFAHHENEKGHGSKGLKCSDYRAVPLCCECHSVRHGGPLGRGIWEVWGIDIEAEIEKLNGLWVKLGYEIKGDTK